MPLLPPRQAEGKTDVNDGEFDEGTLPIGPLTFQQRSATHSTGNGPAKDAPGA